MRSIARRPRDRHERPASSAQDQRGTRFGGCVRNGETEITGDLAAATLREAAFGHFIADGLPHRRLEDWKYTDLRVLMRDAKPLASPPDADAKARGLGGGRIIAGSTAAAWSWSMAHSFPNARTLMDWNGA